MCIQLVLLLLPVQCLLCCSTLIPRHFNWIGLFFQHHSIQICGTSLFKKIFFETLPIWSCYCSYNYKIYNLRVFLGLPNLLASTVHWQGAWKHLSTTSFHIQHSYDRSDAAQSKLLRERPYMHWQTPQQRQEYSLQNVLFFALYQRTVQAYTYR